jgi:hypothetical protein
LLLPQEPTATTAQGRSREDQNSRNDEVPLARTPSARPTPETRRQHPTEHRRDGEQDPATLFQSAAAATTSPAPPGNPTLLSTRLRHGSEVPPLSHHLKGGRRVRGPADRPSAERGTWTTSLSPLSTVARKRKREASERSIPYVPRYDDEYCFSDKQKK